MHFCHSCEEQYDGDHCDYCSDDDDFDWNEAIDVFGFPVNGIESRRASVAFDERN